MLDRDQLKKLHSSLEKIVHLCALRTTTSMPVQMMYGTTPMEEFLTSLQKEFLELQAQDGDKILTSLEADGELQFYLDAIIYLAEPTYDTRLLFITSRIAEHDFEKISKEMYKIN